MEPGLRRAIRLAIARPDAACSGFFKTSRSGAICHFGATGLDSLMSFTGKALSGNDSRSRNTTRFSLASTTPAQPTGLHTSNR